MLGTLVTTDADNYLHHLWEKLGDKLPEDERLEPEGLHCFLRTVNKHAIIIVIMPEPIRMLEAYFTAIAFGPFTDVKPEELDSLPYRYFTLEMTCDPQGNDAGVLMCERRDGKHLNFDGGPAATKEAFLDAVKSFIE